MNANDRRIHIAFDDRREREATEGVDAWGNCSECNAIGHLFGDDEDALLCTSCHDASEDEPDPILPRSCADLQRNGRA